MTSNLRCVAALLLLVVAGNAGADAQIAKGARTARRVGVHRGNAIRTSFTNWGVIGQPGNQGANVAWKFDANGYATDIAPLIGVRLPIRDYKINSFFDGRPDTLVSTAVCDADRSGTKDYSPDGGTFWGFEPVPGFFNPAAVAIGKGVAMSHLPDTWPVSWPDHPGWVDAHGNTEWNGYFGRGQRNADQESYFVMDDNADLKMYNRYEFLPDTVDRTRRGQGIRVSVRGMQWSNFLARDVLFWLYEVTNVGTETYDQTAFGTLVGTYVGVGPSGGDEYDDDASFFNIRENISYTWDFDRHVRPSANASWRPNPDAVGYVGYAFLETPGNQYDGIDNDGDNRAMGGTAPLFTETSFAPRTLHAGDRLTLIDKQTFARSAFVMPASPVTVTSLGTTFRLVPDTTLLAEGNLVAGSGGLTVNSNAYDGIDNDLDGLIDENYQLHYRQYKRTVAGLVLIDTLNPVQYRDYAGVLGMTDPLIDEARNDNADNNASWNRETDDVGLDGKAGTGDFGENDGLPTSGFQPRGPGDALVDTGEPGEPNIDKTDVEESDQLGLTSFQYFVPSTDIDLSNEPEVWRRLQPGRFDVPQSVVNNRALRGEDGDFIFGSGYVPLLPGRTERFSLGLLFGDDLAGAIRTKNIGQIIYNANYNFPRPPDQPTLTAVAGDHQVTLYWDKVAESSFDKTLNDYTFEGYKVYKGTDPDFTDALVISNAYGQMVDYKPVAQYDLRNGVRGLFASDPILYELSGGKPFTLGDDTGLQNSFVDNDVVNGRTYYYAVTAYNRGSVTQSIYPTENPKSISVDALGNVTLDKNTAVVVPNAPSAGYVPPPSSVPAQRIAGGSTAIPYLSTLDLAKSRNATYVVSFVDSVTQGVSFARAYSVVDSASGDTLLRTSPRLWSANGDVFNGMTLSFDTRYQALDSILVDASRSGWNAGLENPLRFAATPFSNAGVTSVRFPRDYVVVVTGAYNDSSSTLSAIFGASTPFRVKRTNFAIYEVTNGQTPVRIPFGYVDKVGGMQDTLSNFDALYLATPDGGTLSWRVTLIGDGARVPQPGDTLRLTFFKPFSSADRFVFRTRGASYDAERADASMNNVRAVPNPYIVTNVFEEPLPAQVRGRGERVINFINLPPDCRISIYTVNGDHVRTLVHGGDLRNGSETWDLRTKEGLDVAFGVYFYVVEADALARKKIGRLAIVK